jgi:Zn-dependent peptidase ImmA (M78 family)
METPPSDPVSARKFGAQIARMVRSEWGVGWGPIDDVLKLLESKGVRLFFVRERLEHLDGFACWTDGIPYIFLNQINDDPARIRLDALHELGHLVMHREVALDARTDLFESMAWGFASEFMAPWKTLEKEIVPLPDLNRLGKLRTRWRMSMQALVKHMHSNGAISDAAYANTFKRFSMLGYRRGPEPVWIMPDSTVIHSKFVEVINAKGLAPAALAERAGIPETLLGDMVPATATVTTLF